MIRSVYRKMLDLLFPGKCIFCQRILTDDEVCACKRCLLELSVHSGENIKVGGASACYSVFYYEKSVRDAVLRFKFSRRESYKDYFGLLMHSVFSAKLIDSVDVISWVPISRRRLRHRGYNQSELLAKEIGTRSGVSTVASLRKIRDNPAQSSLCTEAARRANVLGAYIPMNEELWRGKHILLVDDVVTTGATLEECIRILLTAGAKSVCCLTLAATREHKI